MTATTTQLRSWWHPACRGPRVTMDLHGDGRVTVDPRIAQAVETLNACLVAADYRTRRAVTGAQNCRPITGGTAYSLHAYGIALDLNWDTNGYGKTLTSDMPPAMVAAIKAIRTNSGAQVWRWGGDYSGNKDGMHFEIVVPPAVLATGIAPRGGAGGTTKPSTSTGELTMDAEAKAAFAALTKKVESMGSAVNAAVSQNHEMQRQFDEAEARATGRWKKLYTKLGVK